MWSVKTSVRVLSNIYRFIRYTSYEGELIFLADDTNTSIYLSVVKKHCKHNRIKDGITLELHKYQYHSLFELQRFKKSILSRDMKCHIVHIT